MIEDHNLHKAVALACPNRPFVLSPESYDGLKMLDGGAKPTLQELQQAWDTRPFDIKIWPTKTEFWAEFSDDEKTAILSNEHIGVKRLVNELQMWSYQVFSNDPRIISGISALVVLDLISPQRAEAILGHGLT